MAATIPFATVASFRPPKVNIMDRALSIASALQGMKARNQASQINEAKLANLPASQDAALAARRAQTGLYGAQADLARAKTAQAPTSNLWRNPIALYKYGQQLVAQGKPTQAAIVAQALEKLTSGSKGVSVTTTPSGGSTVQVGGSTGGSPYFGEPIVNPLTKGGRGTKGITYVDQKTGKIYSTPTQQTTGQLQQSVLSDEQLNNTVNDLVKSTAKAKYFDPMTHIAAAAAPFLKYEIPGLSQNVSNLAQVNSGVTAATERTLKQGNLPRTDLSLKKLHNIYMPKIGETQKLYKARVLHQTKLYLKNQEINKKALAKAVPVGHSPYLMVRKAPVTFADYMHPKFDYVHNPEYSVPSAKSVVKPTNVLRETITPAKLQATATKYGMTVQQVKDRLGIK